jgi:hypothetical protein
VFVVIEAHSLTEAKHPQARSVERGPIEVDRGAVVEQE